jgi:hypothetical protein
MIIFRMIKNLLLRLISRRKITPIEWEYCTDEQLDRRLNGHI